MYRLVFLVKRSCITGRKSETKVVGLFFFFSPCLRQLNVEGLQRDKCVA